MTVSLHTWRPTPSNVLTCQLYLTQEEGREREGDRGGGAEKESVQPRYA